MTMNIRIQPQPDDSTCGPTCLQAVYDFYGIQTDISSLADSIETLDQGGTYGVCLGIDALQRGLQAILYSYNLDIFDPTWKTLSSEDLQKKLLEQQKYKHGVRFLQVSNYYIAFLRAGGSIRFADLSSSLLRHFLLRSHPIITGLSATYLYQSTREKECHNGQLVFDDLQGKPMGHFVILNGIEEGLVSVSDPYPENPKSSLTYNVEIQRLLNAILLGDKTYDSNLLILSPNTIPVV